jgi:hypothetical protein
VGSADVHGTQGGPVTVERQGAGNWRGTGCLGSALHSCDASVELVRVVLLSNELTAKVSGCSGLSLQLLLEVGVNPG